jgi:hypothetical protein
MRTNRAGVGLPQSSLSVRNRWFVANGRRGWRWLVWQRFSHNNRTQRLSRLQLHDFTNYCAPAVISIPIARSILQATPATLVLRY